MLFLLFLHKTIFCGYSLEVPGSGASNDYLHHMFSWRNKEIAIPFCKKVPYLELCIFTPSSWTGGPEQTV